MLTLNRQTIVMLEWFFLELHDSISRSLRNSFACTCTLAVTITLLVVEVNKL